MNKLRIVNAQIVNEGAINYGDILIKNNRIENISHLINGCSNEKVIDIKGKLLLPGMIDAHVHFREPGLTHKGSLFTESRAAVSGGITSIMEMPNTIPAAITNKILEEKFTLAKQHCLTNYSFYLGASNNNIKELQNIDIRKICGVKLFLGSSTGNLIVNSEEQIENIFKSIKIPITLHCEVNEIIKKNEHHAINKYGKNIPFSEHSNIRSTEACWLSTKYATELAQKYDTQIHILHMTSAKELKFFTNKSISNKKITVEACPHHLWFCNDDYYNKGSLIKCNPSIKSRMDREALREALNEDLIDTVGTDHAPHLLNEKQDSYLNTPSGMPIVQSAIPSLLEYLSPEKVAEKTAHNPSIIFKCQDRGFIREGYYADLTVIDPDLSHTVNQENILYHCGWSPFDGVTFKNTVSITIINGQIAYQNNLPNDNTRGMRLVFNR